MKKGSLKFSEVDLLEVKAQHSDLLYVLLAKSKSDSHAIYDAQVTVREKDLAIVDILLKFKPQLSDNFSWAWERRDSAKSNFCLFLSQSKFCRWACLAHHVLHGAYNHIDGVPNRLTSNLFARGIRRFTDWFDWILPSDLGL